MDDFEAYYYKSNRNSVDAIVFDPRYGSGKITGIGDSNVYRNICVRFESRPRTSMDSGSKWYTQEGRDSRKDKFPILQKAQPPTSEPPSAPEDLAQAFIDGFKGYPDPCHNPFSEELELNLVAGIARLLKN